MSMMTTDSVESDASKTAITGSSSAKKPGQFANVSGCPWLQTKSPRKSRKRVQIAYPVFEQYSEDVSDTFWKQFFLSIAYGKLPRGFAVRDEVYYRRGGKCHKIPMTEPVEKIIEFFQKHGNFHSSATSTSSHSTSIGLDASTSAQQPLYAVSAPEVVTSWARLQKKQKDILLEYFADDCTTRFGFGFTEYQQLLQLLNVSQILLILDDRIRMHAGRIQSIQGLSLDVRKRKFFISRKPVVVSTSSIATSGSGSARAGPGIAQPPSSSTAQKLTVAYESWLHSYATSQSDSGKVGAGTAFAGGIPSHRSANTSSGSFVTGGTSFATGTTPLGTQMSQTNSSCLETLWGNVLQEMTRFSSSRSGDD